MNIKKIFFITTIALPVYQNAFALDYTVDNWKFKLDADGMAGFLQAKKDKSDFINDWEVKAQMFYTISNSERFGAVYSIDADSVEDKEYVHNAFILFEDRTIGRIEFGLTHSIARKMGLGLPDVGYLNINNDSLLHKELDLKKVLISDTTATTGHKALHLNLATKHTEYGQYGISLSGLTDDYNYAIDMAVKLKQPHGKLKTAYSLALSYMDKPENYTEQSFNPTITADWRGQVALGINLQYNSWILGTSARIIYDHKPINIASDGLVVGSGVSYDLLQYSISLTYLYSDTTIWKHNENNITREYNDYIHTLLASFRYKYSETAHLFMSGGIADEKPFFAVGLKIGF